MQARKHERLSDLIRAGTYVFLSLTFFLSVTSRRCIDPLCALVHKLLEMFSLNSSWFCALAPRYYFISFNCYHFKAIFVVLGDCLKFAPSFPKSFIPTNQLDMCFATSLPYRCLQTRTDNRSFFSLSGWEFYPIIGASTTWSILDPTCIPFFFSYNVFGHV